MTAGRGRFDPNTPPPGVEVIGELPPGTPWWDGEELAMVRRPIATWFRALFFSLAPLLFMSLFYLVLRDANSTSFVNMAVFSVMTIFLCGFLLTISITLFSSAIFRRAAVITPTTVTARGLELAPFPTFKFFPFYRLDEMTDVRYVDSLLSFQCENQMSAMQSKRRKSGSIELATALGQPGLWIRPLLTYRIARAKGENPPPPEFG